MSIFAKCCGAGAHDEKAASYANLTALEDVARPLRELLVTLNDKSADVVNLVLSPEGLVMVKNDVYASQQLQYASKRNNVSVIPYLFVLSATANEGPERTTLTIKYLQEAVKKMSSKLVTLRCTVGEKHSKAATDWCTDLLGRAYPAPPNKRLRALVNPFGGPGKAKSIWTEHVKPVLDAAGCTVEMTYTGPSGSPANAFNVCQTLQLGSYDAIVCVSGDGCFHEILNGLASRPDGAQALRTPVVPIPAGSGNAISANLLGPSKTKDFTYAALAVVKGRPTPLDLCSVTQDGKRYFSFLSQTFGLMADLDLATEHLRWMGPTRFTVGYVQGVLAKRKYPVRVDMKVVDSDKKHIAAQYNEWIKRPPVDRDEPMATVDGSLPPLKFGDESTAIPAESKRHASFDEPMEPGWHTVETDLLFLYGGKLPWIETSVKFFPPARPDGCLDLCVVGPLSRSQGLSAMDNADKGAIFNNPKAHYYKCAVVRVTPLAQSGYIAIDGEKAAHTAFQVEPHAHLARVLSLTGQLYGEPMHTS